MTTPRCAPTAGLVSHWSLQQKILKAYNRLLFATDPDALLLAVLGPDSSKNRQRAAEERFQYVMPELIQKLRPAQQGPVAELLLGEVPDLRAAIQYLIRLERNLTYRDDDPRLLISEGDKSRLRAAGLGRLSQQNYTTRRKAAPAQPTGPPFELTPWPPVVVKLRGARARQRRAVPVGRGQLSLPFPVGMGVATAW